MCEGAKGAKGGKTGNGGTFIFVFRRISFGRKRKDAAAAAAAAAAWHCSARRCVAPHRTRAPYLLFIKLRTALTLVNTRREMLSCGIRRY